MDEKSAYMQNNVKTMQVCNEPHAKEHHCQMKTKLKKDQSQKTKKSNDIKQKIGTTLAKGCSPD